MLLSIFEVFWQNLLDMTWLEFFGVIFGLLSVIFALRGSIWVYPTGIVSTCIYIYLTFIVGYYGDFIINIYYTAMSVYGWVLWSRKTQGESLKITWASQKDWLLTIAIFILTMVFTTAIYLYFDKFENWANYVDVLTTGLAFGSMWLMAKKKVENWLGWIVTDLISVPLYFAKDLAFTSVQFFVFLILAVFGYLEWKKKVKADE